MKIRNSFNLSSNTQILSSWSDVVFRLVKQCFLRFLCALDAKFHSHFTAVQTDSNSKNYNTEVIKKCIFLFLS